MRALGLPHTYEARTRDGRTSCRVVARLRRGDVYDGLNVTVPHKERVLSLARRARRERAASPAPRTRSSAADDGRIVAHNTDAPCPRRRDSRLAGGFVVRPAGARALVLGSGGAARAAIAALGIHLGVARDRGARARLRELGTTRRVRRHRAVPRHRSSRGRASAERRGAHHRDRAGDERGHARRRRGDSVAGVVAWDALPANAVAHRRRLRAAQHPVAAEPRGAAAFRCDDGLGMLARQGALALELWLGPGGEGPLEAMRAALE